MGRRKDYEFRSEYGQCDTMVYPLLKIGTSAAYRWLDIVEMNLNSEYFYAL